MCGICKYRLVVWITNMNDNGLKMLKIKPPSEHSSAVLSFF